MDRDNVSIVAQAPPSGYNQHSSGPPMQQGRPGSFATKATISPEDGTG